MIYYKAYVSPYEEDETRKIKDEYIKPQGKFYNPEEAFLLGNIERNKYKPFKNYRPYLPKVTNEKEGYLLEVMILDNYLHDLNLYLDINPQDHEALMLFNQYSKYYKEKANQYINQYGPILVEDSKNENGYFSWLKEQQMYRGDYYNV